MAKFLTFGVARGLSVKNDYNADIERALRNEELLRQRRLEHEQKATFYAEKTKRGVPYSIRATKQLEPFYDELSKKIATKKLENPNWETDMDAKSEVFSLMDQFLNNTIIQQDQIARKNYEAFIADANSGVLSVNQIEQESNKWKEYNESDPGIEVLPYTYKRPPAFDVMKDIDDAVQLLLKAPESWPIESNVVYGSVEGWKRDRVMEVAKGRLAANYDGYMTSWNNMSPEIREKIYENNPENWVFRTIRNMLPKEKYEPKGAFTGRGSTSGAALTNRPYNINIYNNGKGSDYDPYVKELVPKFNQDGIEFLDTDYADGVVIMRGTPEAPNAVKVSGLDGKIAIKSYSGTWKHFTNSNDAEINAKTAECYTKVQMMMPMSVYQNRFRPQGVAEGQIEPNASLLDIKPEKNIFEGLEGMKSESKAFLALMKGSQSNTVPNLQVLFGSNDKEFVTITGWVRMSNSESAKMAYDQAHPEKFLNSRTIDPYTMQPAGQFSSVPQDASEARQVTDAQGRTWIMYYDANGNAIPGSIQLVK